MNADHLMHQQMMTPNSNDYLRPGSSHIKPNESSLLSGYGTNFKAAAEDDPLKFVKFV